MNIITWLVVGGLVGWVTSKVMNTDGQEGALMNVAAGIVGALIGGWVLGPMVGASTISHGAISIGGVFVSLVGAIALLAIVKFVAQRQAR